MRQDSNLQQAVYKAVALPIALPMQNNGTLPTELRQPTRSRSTALLAYISTVTAVNINGGRKPEDNRPYMKGGEENLI